MEKNKKYCINFYFFWRNLFHSYKITTEIDDEKKRKEEEKNILNDSVIINNDIEDKEMLKKWINPELAFKTKLLYRLS